jgi:biopolymer transport protein ExbD
MGQLNLTPMIDVVFQLLIFFIIGMQIRDPEGILATNLPKEGTGPDPGPVVPEVTVRLMKDTPVADGGQPGVRLFFEQYQCRDLADLEDRLKRLGEFVSRVPVVIDGAPDVPFGYILGAIDVCKKAAFTEIRMKRPPGE